MTTEIIAATPTIMPNNVSRVRSLWLNRFLSESRKIEKRSTNRAEMSEELDLFLACSDVFIYLAESRADLRQFINSRSSILATAKLPSVADSDQATRSFPVENVKKYALMREFSHTKLLEISR